MVENNVDSIQGSFIWKGFTHFWRRKFLGVRLPHRIQHISNHFVKEAHSSSGNLHSQGYVTLGQRSVVDGNFMKPKTHYTTIRSNKTHFHRGFVEVRWSDQIEGDQYPKARSKFRLQVPVQLTEFCNSLCQQDSISVILHGFSIDTADQGNRTSTKSKGFWPYRIFFGIPGIAKKENSFYLNLEIDLFRAWTPNKGGLPFIEEKPMAESITYEVKLFFVIIHCNNDLNISHVDVSQEGKAKNPEPKRKTIKIPSDNSRIQLSGFSSFGFEFKKFLDKKKFNHLGRYIGGLNFRVSDVTSEDGHELKVTNHVWVPETVTNTDVSYMQKITILSFKQSNLFLSREKHVMTCICINSADDARFFSTWKKCHQMKKCHQKFEHTISVMENQFSTFDLQ